jgi:hypothetical protein
MDLSETYIRQLDSAIELHRSNDTAFIVASLAAIARIAGTNSVYADQARSLLGDYKYFYNSTAANTILGVVQALRHDVESGFLEDVRELIHGETFGDFLGMATHLLAEGYKDAAAVIGGGVLESHLRQLCAKFQVETESVNSRGDIESKKADRLNADLKRAEAYNGLDQKSVTTWLDLRNKAAHAEYGEYTKEEVGIFLSWLTDFLTRHPA